MPFDADRAAGPTARAGLLLGAAAGVLVAIAPTGDLAEGPARGAERMTATIDLEPVVAAVGVVGALLLVGAALAPWLWAHLAGVALTTILAATAGLIVVSGRTSDDFAVDADVSLRIGGVLLVLAFWIGLAGVIVTLVGFRQTAMAASQAALDAGAPAPEEVEGVPQKSRKALVALVLGVAGFITVIASSLAIAFATLALGDIRASGGRLGGRGMAMAGLVLGVVTLSLLAALVGLGTLTAKPT
jgi:hypothetical protein